MNDIKRITANIPEKLLNEAIEVSGKNITETLIEGLKLFKRRKAFEKAQKLKGKVEINVNIGKSRERNYR